MNSLSCLSITTSICPSVVASVDCTYILIFLFLAVFIFLSVSMSNTSVVCLGMSVGCYVCFSITVVSIYSCLSFILQLLSLHNYVCLFVYWYLSFMMYLSCLSSCVLTLVDASTVVYHYISVFVNSCLSICCLSILYICLCHQLSVFY